MPLSASFLSVSHSIAGGSEDVPTLGEETLANPIMEVAKVLDGTADLMATS